MMVFYAKMCNCFANCEDTVSWLYKVQYFCVEKVIILFTFMSRAVSIEIIKLYIRE